MYDKLCEELKEGGAEIIGCSYWEDTPYKGLLYAVSFGVRLSDAIIDTINEEGPSKTYFHHYRTVNALLDSLALRTVILLQRNGFNAANIPASQSVEGYRGLFSHKAAAVKSGLGWIGKNAMFISREIGPRVRLATVFTDMPLPVIEHEYKDGCGECTVCRDMCPSGAISGINWSLDVNYSDFFDPELCSTYMKEKFKNIGRGAVCGICMRYCPYGIRRRNG